jgi:hypothetical protein
MQEDPHPCSPTRVMKTTSGADPLVCAGPPGPGLRVSSISHQADEGVGCGPGGPPHSVFITFGGPQAHGHSLAVAVRPLFPEVLCLSHLLKTLRLSELLPGELRDKFE